MKADIVNLTYNIWREEFKDLIKNTLLIKELIYNWFNITNLWSILDTKYWYSSSALDDWNVKMIRITDLKNNNINLNTVPFCNCKNYKDYLVEKWDILIWRTWTVWKSFLLDYDLKEESIYASYLIRLKINKEKVLPEYVYLYLNSYYFWNQLHEIKSWAVKMNINANKIKGLQIPICSIEEQKNILDKKYNWTSWFEEALNTVSNIHFLYDSIQNQNYIKLLKQSILQEAIEWKLTKTWRENNKDIESASILLEKIKAEKEELIKQNKLKKQKELNPILEDKIPFDIPENWKWCRLGDIWIVKWWKRRPSWSSFSQVKTEYPYLRVSDMKDWYIKLDGLEYLDEKTYETLKWYKINDTDLYITIVGWTIWKCWVLPKECNWIILTENALKITPLFSNKYYIYQYMIWTYAQNEFKDKTNQLWVQKLSMIQFRKTLFPLPPLEEQKEIVKRVDEMMKLCDELEKQTLETKENSENLMKAVLGEVFNK